MLISLYLNILYSRDQVVSQQLRYALGIQNTSGVGLI